MKFFGGDLVALGILVSFFVAMVTTLIVAIKRKSSLARTKSTILTLGMLGTFVGISYGLFKFDAGDTEKISNSIPHLLEGLKLAFYSSIIGMFLTVIMPLWSKETPERENDFDQEDEDALTTISQSNVYILKLMNKIYNEILCPVKEKSEIHFEGVSDSLEKIKTSLGNNLNEKIDTIDTSINNVLNEIATGASEAIVQALEQTMSNFNENLQEHFGENFQQLNEACGRLVEWQENYRVQVEQNTELLSTIRDNLGNIIEVHERIEQMMTNYGNAIQTLEQGLGNFNDIATRANENLTDVEHRFNTIMTNMNNLVHTTQQGQQAIINANNKFQEYLKELDKSLAKNVNQFVAAYKKFLDELPIETFNNGANQNEE